MYYSFLELMDKKRIASKITFTESGTIMFNNVREATGKFDYEYTGYTKEEDSNIFIHLKNKHSLEQVEISLVKSVGELDRYIGLFMATSPVLAPVYEELVQIINDYLKLSENEFERKWLSVQAILNDNNIDELLHEIKREWKEDYTVLKGDKFEVFMNEIGVIDEISRIYEKISLERYRKLLSMSKDYVELSTKDFIEKWGKVQISIGIDKFALEA